MASLVSNFREIDPVLDDLRIITSSLSPNQALTPGQRTKLAEVRTKIEDYLMHRDQLRAFSKTELQARIDQYLSGARKRSQHRVTRSLLSIIGLSFVLGALPFVVPNQLAPDERSQLALPLFLAGMHGGVAWLFLSALKNFQPQLRRAYGWVVAGLVLVGIFGSQLTFIKLFGWAALPWFHYQGFMPVFAASYFPLFMGVYVFARQLGIRSWLTSGRLFAGFAIALSLAAYVLPHKQSPTAEIFFDISLVSFLFCTLLVGWGAALAFAVARTLTPVYAKAMKFLGWSYAFDTLGVGSSVAVLAVTGDLSGQLATLTLLPFIVSEIWLVCAGYSFKKHAEA